MPSVLKARERWSALGTDVRVLVVFTFLTLIGLFIMIICVAMPNWIIVNYVLLDSSGNTTKNGYATITRKAGLWRLCRLQRAKPANEGFHCEIIPTVRLVDQLAHDRAVDETLRKFSQSSVAFAIIGLGLMVFGNIIAFYTIIRLPRYTFKRLTGVIHLMTAAAVFITIEVFINGATFERNKVKFAVKESLWSYGACFVMSWVVFGVFLVAGVLFIVFSRKRAASPGVSSRGQYVEADGDLYIR